MLWFIECLQHISCISSDEWSIKIYAENIWKGKRFDFCIRMLILSLPDVFIPENLEDMRSMFGPYENNSNIEERRSIPK